MKHIRYMDTRQPICHEPARLDKFDTPVILDADYYEIANGSCRDCSAALMTHNTRVFEDEAAFEHNFKIHKQDDGLRPARGCINGVLISSLFWIVLIVGLYLYFFRG